MSAASQDFRPSIGREAGNESSYQLKINGVENLLKAVFEFECKDQALSSDYNVVITIKALKLTYDKVIGQNASLIMNWGDKESVYMHGLIKNISLINKVQGADNLYYYVL